MLNHSETSFMSRECSVHVLMVHATFGSCSIFTHVFARDGLTAHISVIVSLDVAGEWEREG